MTDTAQKAREFRMPDVGEGLTEAELLRWYVKPGDEVTDGQMVCEVETAKAVVELPIPFDGVVTELLASEGETVDVGRVIIRVGSAGGGSPAAPASPNDAATGGGDGGGDAAPEPGKRTPVLVGYGVSTAPARRRRRTTTPPAEPAAAKDALTLELDGSGDASGRSGDDGGPDGIDGSVHVPAPSGAAATGPRPLAKPPVRKLAKDLGVDLASVRPSGPHGTITRDDVRQAAQGATTAVAAAASASATEPAPMVATYDAATRERRVPVRGVRKVTADAMVASAFTAPHVTEFVTFDMTETMSLVQELKHDRAFEGRRVSPLLMVAKAFLVAIKRNPEVNASWDASAQEIVYKDYVNLGIAAATPRGLIVPNVKDADRLTLPQLAAALDELVSTAREGKTTPAAMQGGTATITNVGVFGVDTGTPILPPGESAILAFGAVKPQPWVHEGAVVPRQVTTLALSFDHRLVDGELGSKVLADTAAILEQPKRLFAWT